MELNDLKLLAASSLLADSVHSVTSDGGRTSQIVTPGKSRIEAAVKVAGEIWDEVLRQDREET